MAHPDASSDRRERLTDLARAHSSARQTAHEFAHQVLRMSILRGIFPPGTHLVQSDLANDLDLSVTPVREALRNLATEGLIDLHPHRGAAVRAINIDEARDIMELRRVVEPLAVRRAAERAEPSDLVLLGETLGVLQAEQDPQRWVEAHRRFHEQMIASARSPMMSATVRQLRHASDVYVAMTIAHDDSQRGRGAAAHARLLDALGQGDVDGAERLMIEHLAQAFSAVEANLDRVARA